MFDILVYLFENYFEAEIHPDHGKLARELSAAGDDCPGYVLAWALRTPTRVTPMERYAAGSYGV